jgi:hypothetical protein
MVAKMDMVASSDCLNFKQFGRAKIIPYNFGPGQEIYLNLFCTWAKKQHFFRGIIYP